MHKIFINRCLDLAQKAIGQTYPNPMVGAVIVHNRQIIGEGVHQKAGEPHAEINAINSVKKPELLKDSTIYVSLEPCAHFGKTPPCALKLKEIGFKKVIIGTLDNHDKVNGKGIQILKSAGIECISGILEKECQNLNKRFFTFHQKKRPFIILKWAESKDGFLDKNFQSTKISNPLVNQWVHQLRSEEHAILVGTKTALTDNPTLTTRHLKGRNPIRILIDLNLKIPSCYNIFNDKAQTIVFNSIKNETKSHIQFIKIERENLLKSLISELYHLEIQSIIIEGGSFTLQQFIDANLWDEAYIIRNEDLLLKHGTLAPKIYQQPINTKTFRDNYIEFYQNEI